MRKASKHQRAPIEIVNGHPTLRGYLIRPDELLEVRRDTTHWEQVFLDRSHDRRQDLVLRFVRNPDSTVLATGHLARRVMLSTQESLDVIAKARAALTPIPKRPRVNTNSSAKK